MVRKATLSDVKEVYEIVERFARKGEMLHRPLNEIYANLRDFFVYEEDGKILGVCALHICWEELGEIRSLAVREEAARRRIGTSLVRACVREAKALGVRRLFALTYSPAFFEKLGFSPVEKDTLPHKIWGECVSCVKFPYCDETAVAREVR